MRVVLAKEVRSRKVVGSIGGTATPLYPPDAISPKIAIPSAQRRI